MDQQQSTPDQYQYIKLPDGSYGKFASGASDDEIRGHIQQDFPNAFKAPDERNSMQRSFDTETQTNPKEPLLQTGLKSVVGGAGSMFVHPLKSLQGMSDLIMDPFETVPKMVDAAKEDYKQGGLPYAAVKQLGNLAGGYAAGTGVGAGMSSVAPMGNMLRSGAAGLDNAAIGATAGDAAYGGNAGRAMATNRIMGSNAATLAPKLKELIPNAVAEHRGIIAASPSGVSIPAGKLVSEPFDSIMADKLNPRTGVAAPSSISRAGNVRDVLTHVPNDVTGRPTPMMRDPNLTPLEATELKSNIYDMTDYDNPSQSALSNKGLKGAAHGLKTAVEKAVPESMASGQRLHDLMTATDILEPSARLVKLPTSKAGVFDRCGHVE